MELEEEFTRALNRTVIVARRHGYNPARFAQMLAEYGGVKTAKMLLADNDAQAGLNTLWELHLLGESMEAVVLREEFKLLFTKEEIDKARQRLNNLNYFEQQSQ
jgi:hypothetical protein